MAARMRTRLMQAYWRVEQKIAPGLRYSQLRYEEVLADALAPGTRWLDIGCGHQALPPWRLEAERELVARSGLVVGVDPDHASLLEHATIRLRTSASASDLPFPDGTFDLVTANMVVEHLAHPEAQFGEVSRVLRNGGLFLFHTPNARSYTTILARIIPSGVKKRLVGWLEDRREEDLFPTHYRANTGGRLRDLARSTGFEVVRLESVVGSAEFAMVLPVAVLELLWIRLLMLPQFEGMRHTFIGTIRKPHSSTVGHASRSPGSAVKESA